VTSSSPTRRRERLGHSANNKSDEERKREEREAEKRYEQIVADLSREVSSEEFSAEMPDGTSNP
jgi:hypothetical protein